MTAKISIFPQYRYGAKPHLSEDLYAHFQDASRPCLVIGNGPSAAGVDYARVPDDAYIFRCNWFFLENDYLFGKTVDAYFWSVYNAGLHQELLRARETYDIKNYLFPFVLNDNLNIPGPDFELSPTFDHWAVLAKDPFFARAMMSRPLPTQGVQMIATALSLGMREIHVVGIDFYANPEQRYNYAVPDSVKKHLKEKDFSGGYEGNHALAVDMTFLELTLSRYPDAKLYSHSLNRKYPSLFLDPPPAARPMRGVEAKAGRDAGASAIRRNRVTGKQERVAYVTFATENFRFGVKALAGSLAKVSDIPLVVMVHPEDERLTDGIANATTCVVEPISNPNALKGHQERFAKTYSKLAAFGLPFLDKFVYVDADAIVLKSIDELFDLDGFHAAPDIGFNAVTDEFNSGLFVSGTGAQLFKDMTSSIAETASNDGGDQGFLNEFFKNEVKFLNRNYNCLKRVYTELPVYYEHDEVKVLHFVGVKPWDNYNELNTKFRKLDALWFSMLSESDQAELFLQIRSKEISAESVMKQQYGDAFIDLLEQAKIRREAKKIAGGKTFIDASDDFFFSGEIEKSILISKAALSITQNSTEHMYRLARAYTAANRRDEALSLIDEALKKAPHKQHFRSLKEALSGRPPEELNGARGAARVNNIWSRLGLSAARSGEA
ncbi:MAG: hypothetical protein DI565_19700 [Ancylobacter novellus]|uniref:Uncharacterized protein n=1 Tax=Ancylobacter novellus TaxID=921 RepID=A0A2W5K627_ANCNO|nr:MAG: hypothetical protein DI565_19700 [Ancylobacter novellus]